MIPRLLVLALLLLFVSLALIGCGHKPNIVGKWQGTISRQGETINATFDFGRDGKETIDCLAKRGLHSLSYSESGTYMVSGNSLDGYRLTQNITTFVTGSFTVPAPHQADPFAPTQDYSE